MKQRNLKKKVGSLLLAVAMLVTSFPAFSHEVHAAENQLPTEEQFATVEELKKFNTNDNDGKKNPAMVYFGNNSQKWWIAGSQDGNLTLFAESPLATRVQFNQNTNERNYEGQTVDSNHYGASYIKSKLKTMETDSDYFSTSEQGLMLDTPINTDDTRNNSNYLTTDKLYLAYGDYNDGQYVTVGKNASTSLNNGLRIDKDYWGGSDFWLRAPDMDSSFSALAAWPGYGVSSITVVFGHALVPAFELNLSSVIFASAARAASSEGKFSENDAFTLRYKADSLGSALVSYDKSQVTLTNVPENTYLVVQNSSGAWAKKITNEKEVSASTMGVDSFANCKIWLEITDTTNRMTYATLAVEEQGYDVNITASEGLTVINGMQGVGQGSAITDVTVEVADGYYLPEDYISNLQIQLNNGLSVAETDNGFKISGTPTSDVTVTLPAATVLPKADTPEIKTTQTANSITVEVANYKSYFGTTEYNWNNTGWTNQNKLVNKGANKAHKVSVRFTGQGIYQPSDEKTVDVSTAPATYEISIPMTVAADDKENMIGIDGSKDFDLGYNGKVNVKIKNTDAFSNGAFTLTRENGNNETITSQLLVGGNPFTDLSQNVATFTNKSAPSVPFVFQRPATSNILAGTYKGTVVFDISYSED